MPEVYVQYDVAPQSSDMLQAARGRKRVFGGQTPCYVALIENKNSSRLAREFFVFQSLRLQCIRPKAALFVFLIIFKVAFEPFDVRIAFKGEHMGTDAVKEEAVVGDDHGAAGEVCEGVFERAQGFDVEIVCRFVEQQDVAAFFEQARHVDAIALAA